MWVLSTTKLFGEETGDKLGRIKSLQIEFELVDWPLRWFIPDRHNIKKIATS